MESEGFETECPAAIEIEARALSAACGLDPCVAPACCDALRAALAAAASGSCCAAVPADLAQAAAGERASCAAAAQAIRQASDAASPWAAAVLVPGAQDRIYLARLWGEEQRLAAALARKIREPRIQGIPAPAAWPEHTSDEQKAAVALALTGHLTVITGGPGTGKTSTVAALLQILDSAQPGLRIALAAPTGKAADRMTQSLRMRLPPGSPLKSLAAKTVHRLLGWSPRGFRHGARHPLNADVVVVDEVSMLDTAMAARLVQAVRPGARLILLGDHKQLASVEPGAVFARLSANPGASAGLAPEIARLADIPLAAVPLARTDPEALPGDLCLELRAGHRFDSKSSIGKLEHALRERNCAGSPFSLEEACGDCADGAVAFRGDGARHPSQETVDFFHAVYSDYRNEVGALAETFAQASFAQVSSQAMWPLWQRLFRAYEAVRILSPLRQGPWGVAAVNAVVRARFPGIADAAHEWYCGCPVIVTANDYGTGLFNGDIGIAMEIAQHRFAVGFVAGDGSVRAFAASRVPASHETAFAITVHKSQGSEFGHAVVLVPPLEDSSEELRAIMTREIVYTAVTRARQRVTLVGSRSSLAQAVDRTVVRLDGLREAISSALNCK